MQQAQPLSSAPQPRVRHSIVGPVLLIGLGLLILAQNFGLVSGSIWGEIWRFWPLVFVLLGLELVLGRASWGSVLLALFATIVVIAVAGAAAFMAAPGMMWRGPFGGDWGALPAGAVTETWGEELGVARRAAVDLRHGAGRLTVGALPAETGQLVAAELVHGEDVEIQRSVRHEGDQTTVQLRGRAERGWMFGSRDARQDWTVNLAPTVPTELRVATGASQVSLDLRKLTITRLTVDSGASALTIVLPEAAGFTEAQIHAGAAGIDITIPEGVAARIRTQGGLSGVSVDENRFPPSGRVYESPGYEAAAHRVDLQLESGVSGITIR